MSRSYWYRRTAGAWLALLLVTGCQAPGGPATATAPAGPDQATVPVPALSTRDAWVQQPLGNTSADATAGEMTDVLLETHLRRQRLPLLVSADASARYRVGGEVSTWQYASGAGARPSVALTLTVTDTHSDTLVWSDSAAAEGRRQESLSALADRLTASLVDRLPLTDSLSASAAAAGDSAHRQASARAVGASLQTASAGGSLVAGLALKAGTPLAQREAAAPARSLSGRSVAFYYAASPPVDVLSQFDRLVLEPDNIHSTELTELTAHGAVAYAYLSVGEVGAGRAYASALDPRWILGENADWGSQVLDLSSADLRDFLIGRVGQLREAGYQGVFLDTMDSFNLVAHTPAERARQSAGLVALVEGMAHRFPGLKIMANRGFEVLDRIAPHLEAVAAESLYAGWNNAEQRYTAVPDNDREWLLSRLEHARDQLGLEVIAIDYLPPQRRDEARTVAARIAAHGFIPWVATPALDYIGIGALEVLPRRILMLHDTTVNKTLEQSPVHRLVAMPLEYMGYVPDYLDIVSEPLPAGELRGRYAGIVIWPDRPLTLPSARAWIQKQLDAGVPVAFLNRPPVALDDAMKASLGIRTTSGMDVDSAKVVHRDDHIRPERTLSRRIDSLNLMAVSEAAQNRVHLSYADQHGQRSDVVVTGPFGGFAWRNGLVEDGLDYETYWVIDPFRFLRTALQLPDAPMPDVTSENGKRLWLAHIDGDALPSWAEMPGKQLGAELIYEQILTRYRLPHTVSVVEGEMTEFSAYDDRRQRMFDIARKIFRLPNVELASHTYSHPFAWGELGEYRKPGRYNLNIPGYEYSPERDIAGSIAFIDRELAPPGKRTAVMLWSGNALPQAEDLAVVERLGLPNMNGGATYISDSKPTLSLISPMARPVDDYLQVYAPVMNENLYTDDWLGPFDGFRQAVETFKLTEAPRRIKPLNIYYHFYSGTKIASLKALEAVYDWSVQQDIFPLYGSDYARKVPDYRHAGVARYLDGRWKLSGLGTVRSLRLLQDPQWPELAGSQGIVGARRLHDGLYIHTDGSDRVEFATQASAPRRLHLVSSNGRVLQWQADGRGLQFRVRAEVPVVVELGGNLGRSCTVFANGRSVPGMSSAAGTMIYRFTTMDTGDASLSCPA